MGAPGAYRALLVAELEAVFDEVIGFPPDLLPSGEVVVVYPSDPYIEPGIYCDWVASFTVMVFYSRTNEAEALDRAEETVEKVQDAAHRAGGSWGSMAYRPINVAGVEYLTAVHVIVFNEEG